MALTTMVYPSGRRVSFGYDAAGRITSATGLKEGATTNYVSNASYAPHGAFSSLQIGGVRTEQWCYNSRMQPVAMRVGASVSTNCAWTTGDLLRLGYAYGSANNGNVQSQSVTRPSYSVTQSYTYDALNRLASFTEGSGWSRSHSYNRWGNLWVSATSGFALSSFTPVAESNYNAQNRILMQAAGYDVAGNLNAIGGYTFTYDRENRMTSSTINGSTTVYGYDGEGRRVKKGSAVYVYDAFGNLAAEYGGASTESGPKYLVQDHLGSTRLEMTAAGAEARCFDYEPFGEQLLAGVNGRPGCYGSSIGSGILFTGKERDAETVSSAMQGLDYFGARYYSGAQGRFTSPDAPFADQHPIDPQSWNLYAYVRNNPLRYVDPTGNAIELLGDEEQRKKELALLRASVGNKQAASRLYFNEVKQGDATRYFVGIQGNVGDFKKLSETAHDLADLVGHKNVVEFGLTSQNLTKFGGAVTYEKGEAGNQNIRVLVNPDQMDITNRNLNPNTILGASRWEGQNVRPRWNVNDFSTGVATWHEFGHAWGFINGRPGSQTNAEALQWENRMRQQVYGPLGPRNARRIRH
jgi:RHS repeat-associated protein